MHTFRKEAGCATEAKLEGRKYSFLLETPYRWDSWATTKNHSGQIDNNKDLMARLL